MTRDREGDVSRKRQVVRRLDAWIQPDGTVRTKNQGMLIAPRWYYRDNPVNGLGEKEFRMHFSKWENRSPGVDDEKIKVLV